MPELRFPRLARLLRNVAAFALGYGMFALTILVHGMLRGRGDDAGSSATYSMVGIEHRVFHGMPSLWLQQWTPQAGDIFPGAAFVVWSSLFYAPLLLCAVAMAARGPRAFLGLLALHAVLVFSADAVYALFPTRPPWMELPVTRMIEVWSNGAVAIDNNAFASSPSLHVGVPAAYALWFWGAGGNFRRVGVLLGVWTVLMTWAVVYTGEHYVIGALAGIAWAAAAYVALARIRVLYGRPLVTTGVPAPVDERRLARPELVAGEQPAA